MEHLEIGTMPARLCDDNKRPVLRPWQSPYSRWPATDDEPNWDKVDDALHEMLIDCSKGKHYWPLVVHGPRGTGKTYAGRLMTTLFGGWIGTLAELAATRNLAVRGELWVKGTDRSLNELEWWDHWQACPLVVVDEIGLRTSETDARYETLHTAIEKRVGKPSIHISNLSLPELTRLYDDRIGSRFGGGTIFKIAGKDRRLTKER